MMQTAEPWHRYNFAMSTGLVRGFAIAGSSLRKREMGPVPVVVANVINHQAFQMLLVQNNHMIEQVAAAVADPALGNAVLPWAQKTGPLWLDAETLYRLNHFFVELSTAIKDQVSGYRVKRECLAQLLNDPRAGRMFGHVEVQDAAPVMRDDEEAVENSERERGHGEKVHRGDGFTMVAEKGRPPLCRLKISRTSLHPAQHSSFRNIKTKHFQLTVNPRGAPSGILCNHAEDDFSQVLADASSTHAGSMPREPRPIQLGPCTVPANNGLRLDEDQCPLPSRPEPPQDQPEQLVGHGKSRLRVPPFQNPELLMQRQVFQEQVVARTGGSNEWDEQEPQRTRHGLFVAETYECSETASINS